jgi:hypothetical protein
VMAGKQEARSRKDSTMRDISPNIVVTVGGQPRVYSTYVATAGPEFDRPSDGALCVNAQPT